MPDNTFSKSHHNKTNNDLKVMRNHSNSQQTQSKQKWYAVQAYSCREKIVDQALRKDGIDSYLPLLAERHRWSDRTKTIYVPLFPGYLFVNVDAKLEEYTKVKYNPSVCSILGGQSGPTPVDEQQIEDIKRMIDNDKNLKVVRGFYKGQKVEIKSGPLQGMVGEYVQTRVGRYLAIHINILGQTVLVELEPCDIQPY